MSKSEKYRLLLEQVRSLVAGESDPVANLANAAAAIHGTFAFWWTGFYLVKDDLLVLGLGDG